MSQKIIISEQDITEEFAPEIAEILSLLGFEERNYMVTDDSSLGDFYCRYPESASHYDVNLNRRRNGEIWEAWLAGVWAGKFPGASSENLVDTPLVRLAQRVRASRVVH